MTDYLKKLEQQALTKNSKQQTFLDIMPKSFQKASGLSGLPYKRLIQLTGSPYYLLQESGLNLIYEALQHNKTVLLMNNEYDINLSKFKNLYYYQAEDPNTNFKILHKLLKSNSLDIILINTIQLLFSLLYNIQWFRTNLNKTIKLLKQSETVLIIINPYNYSRYNILTYYTDLNIYIKKLKNIYKNNQLIGFTTINNITKNNINLKYNIYKDNINLISIF